MKEIMCKSTIGSVNDIIKVTFCLEISGSTNKSNILTQTELFSLVLWCQNHVQSFSKWVRQVKQGNVYCWYPVNSKKKVQFQSKCLVSFKNHYFLTKSDLWRSVLEVKISKQPEQHWCQIKIQCWQRCLNVMLLEEYLQRKMKMDRKLN